MPLRRFPEIEALPDVAFLRPSLAQTSQAGSVVSEALQSLQVDKVRATINATLTGEGITIGVLSDSYNNHGGAAADVASGDLPNDVIVAKELSSADGTDEGRAMIQLIHDLVPGAKALFYTAFEGPEDFANGIRLLAEMGCDIIVDDVSYFLMPFIQDGVIAQAANDVAQLSNVPYFSAAGNQRKTSWEGVFKPSGQTLNGCELHDFGGGQVRQRIVPSSVNQILVLQWSDPFFSVSGPPGTLQDIDIFVLEAGTTNVITQDDSNNVGGDPFAFVQFGVSASYDIVIAHCNAVSAPPPLMKWISFRRISSIGFDTKSPTSFGHPNGEFTAGVGAAFFQNTPAFGTDPPVLESFSSRGGTPILFNIDGSRKAVPEIRLQPRFTATDGTITTIFGRNTTFEPNGLGFYFFGTSAAAPHAAAVAALMLQVNPDLTPLEVYDIMSVTAIDMETLGFDFDSGAGLVDALAAVVSALDASSTPQPLQSPSAAPTSQPSQSPSAAAMSQPAPLPTASPAVTPSPTSRPFQSPSALPTSRPSPLPAASPVVAPSPTLRPLQSPSAAPTSRPSPLPSASPAVAPTPAPFGILTLLAAILSSIVSFILRLLLGDNFSSSSATVTKGHNSTDRLLL